jgi:hypothetical protein
MEPLDTWPRGVVAMHLWPLRYADCSGSAPRSASEDVATLAAREVIQIASPRRLLWV